jgi:uncharacterized repeat protein (TIGR02543 family)
MKNYLFAVALAVVVLFVGCNKSPTGPQDTSTTYCILATTESSSVGDVLRVPDKDTYKSGDTITLIAKPRSGYAFSGWSGDTTVAKDTIKIIIKKNTTIYADFINMSTGKKVYTVNTLSPDGTILFSPIGGVYDSGTVVTATAQPSYGFIFSEWEGAISGTNSTTTLLVKNNTTIIAKFTLDPNAVFATVHINPVPTNGTISIDPQGIKSSDGYKYKPGAQVTVTAVPDNSYELVAWGGDFAQTSVATNSFSTIMSIDRTISAIFSKAPEGTKWTKRTSGTENGLIFPIWDGKQIVVAGNGGLILTSVDGVNWTTYTTETEECLNCIIWAGNKYVGVGDGGVILTSTDAKSWMKQNSTTTYPLQAVVWTGTQYVAMGGYIQDSGTNYGCLLTSPDGVTWTSHPMGSGIWYCLAWSGKKMVGAGFDFDYTTVSDNSSSFLEVSSDGVSWSSCDTYIPKSTSLTSIIWTGTQFVAVGGCRSSTYPENSVAYTSVDGLSWNDNDFPTTSFISSVTWTGNTYVAVGNDGKVYTSQNTIDWTSRESGTTDDLFGVTWTGSQVVAVGYGGLILTSP